MTARPKDVVLPICKHLTVPSDRSLIFPLYLVRKSDEMVRGNVFPKCPKYLDGGGCDHWVDEPRPPCEVIWHELVPFQPEEP